MMFNRIKRTGILLILTFFVTGFGRLFAESAVPQVFLIQNSGWMLPFYEDSSSRFKELVAEISFRVYEYGAREQVIASFNQSWGSNQSPKLHYRGNDQKRIRQAIASIEPARKPGKQVYTDTDFKEAIIGAIKGYSPGKPCLLWIVTNNKNSPDNDHETVERNKEFYTFVNESDQIKRIVAFPYSMNVQSITRSDYTANGLMIYVMAYGEEADLQLRKMLAKKIPFGAKTARLKPLNTEAITFVPKYVRGNENVKVRHDNRTLYLGFDAKSRPEIVEITGKFINDFYPYDIASANVAMFFGFSAKESGISAQLSTNTIQDIESGKSSPDITVSLTVPPIPSPWEPEVIFGSGYTSSGVIRFELSDQRLELSTDFQKAMDKIFPGDPLPELFVPGEISRSSMTTQPLVIQVTYPSWPLVVFGLLFFVFTGIAIGGFILFRKEKTYRVSVDGIQKNFGLRPFTEAAITNASGERCGVIKRGLTGASLVLEKDKTDSSRVRLL